MTDRLSCCVPFCRRTVKAGGFKEWVCGKHWPLVPRDLKRSYTLAKRRARAIVARRPGYREYWKLKPGSPDRMSAVAMWRRLDGCWRRCRDAAIERAAGL